MFARLDTTLTSFLNAQLVYCILFLIFVKNQSPAFRLYSMRKGIQYTSWALRKLVKVVSKRANIKKRVYPHLFRHTIASILVQKGANLMTIMSLLGHKNYATTLIYAQFSPQRISQEYNYFCPVFS